MSPVDWCAGPGRWGLLTLSAAALAAPRWGRLGRGRGRLCGTLYSQRGRRGRRAWASVNNSCRARFKPPHESFSLFKPSATSPISPFGLYLPFCVFWFLLFFHSLNDLSKADVFTSDEV